MMSQGDKNTLIYKALYRGGYVVYAALLVFAIVFYKERTIFLDIAFHLFHIVKSGSFAFQVHRYSAAVTQVFPLVASKLLLPLPAVMMIYSAGAIVYYTICYWLCGSVLKNYKAGLALVISQLLLLTDSFYWLQSELQQGLAFIFVVFAWLDSNCKAKPLNILMLCLLLVLAIFFHPLVIIPLGFGLAFFLFSSTSADTKKLPVVAGAICILLFALKWKLLPNNYDYVQMQGPKNVIKLFPHYFNLPSHYKFLAHWADRYYWFPLLFIFISAVYIHKKQWMLFFLFASFTIGFTFLINISYPTGAEKDFYIENLYLPLGVMLALPFVYHVIPVLQNRKLSVAIVAVILLTGLARIYNAHNIRTARLDWERTFLQENLNRKLIVYDREVPMDTLLMTWGTPYEFWLLSTTEYGNTASIVIDEHADKLFWCMGEKKQLLTIMENFKYEDLPSPYFRFTDTTTHYELTKQ